MLTSLCPLIVLYLRTTDGQTCDAEVTEEGISVTWHQSPPANNVLSDPVCYNNDYIITRNCENTHWIPPLPILKPCLQVFKHYDLLTCPPSFDRVSDNNDEYCYQIGGLSSWNGPCFKSGGASVITDLREDDLFSLLKSLTAKNISRFFWLPARREKKFNPVRWYIPGPKWGLQIKANNSLRVQTSFLKKCLVLDVHQKLITTETCSMKYPSLCLYINEMHYPAQCPEKYHAVRFMPDEGICYGIELSNTPLTFDEFLSKKCSIPMGEENNNDLSRFIFKKIALLNILPNNIWCWFTRTKNIIYELNNNVSVKNDLEYSESTHAQVIINSIGTLRLLNSSMSKRLPCMACVTEMVYENTEFTLEYSTEEHLMYLTVYSPSGLWKYNNNDRGIQCFSNAKGFVNVIDIKDLPFGDVKSIGSDLEITEQNVYIINLVTDRSAQYWCEGHTKNFSLITTEKLFINPQGNKEHVFSLVLLLSISSSDIDNLDNMVEDFCQNITFIFNAKKALIMDMLEYSTDNLLILFHLHVEVEDKYESLSQNIVDTYENLVTIAKMDLIHYNYIFVNISSALYCLPTTSIDNSMILDWEMTLSGHIAAPTQFCLQANGLPVKRLCVGSYLLGNKWGNVEGTCDKNYVPSRITTFLYNFVKDKVPKDHMFKFLTDGLGTILSDVDLLIPADIYYLAMSLKHVLSIAHINSTSVDLSDIDNIAWVMNRMLSLHSSYLRLAQTLNSTNVILDSINEIIEILSFKNTSVSRRVQNNCEIVAIQPQFIIQILHPEQNNVSGIAIINNKSTDNFREMDIKYLYRNSTLDEVLFIENLEVAAWLPDSALSSLRKNIKNNNESLDDFNVSIVITIFHNDAIFQELQDNEHKVNSRLIGISIPGFILNFNNFVSLVFKDLRQYNSEKFCGYWDFKSHKKENALGAWSRRGCFLEKKFNNMTICKCYHLTHFSHLLNIHNYNNGKHINEKHTKALNIITLIGSFISLLGIACIWITACVFQTWRTKVGTKVLLHFTVSIALPLLFMVIFNLDDTIVGEQNGVYTVYHHMKAVCITLGALLHYSVLASFMWMLTTALLQFVRYVRVLGVRRPSRLMVKLTIIGWGVPIIPVLAVLHISKESYIPDVASCYKCSICYPKGMVLLLSVVTPVCLILFTNVILFIIVLWSVSKGPDGKFRGADLNLIKAQMRLSVFLFFLFGLTWIFGFFSFSKQLIWSYLFCLTSSLQGFVLFVYFILCDPNTRGLWVTLMKSQYRPRQQRESISSISSG